LMTWAFCFCVMREEPSLITINCSLRKVRVLQCPFWKGWANFFPPYFFVFCWNVLVLFLYILSSCSDIWYGTQFHSFSSHFHSSAIYQKHLIDDHSRHFFHIWINSWSCWMVGPFFAQKSALLSWNPLNPHGNLCYNHCSLTINLLHHFVIVSGIFLHIH
jgi:hypothetical protein